MKKLVIIAAAIFALITVVSLLLIPAPGAHGPETVQHVRQILRDQGFKTDFSDFNFSTPDEMRQREAALSAAGLAIASPMPENIPELRELADGNHIFVAWRADLVKKRRLADSQEICQWNDVTAELESRAMPLDTTTETILSGPIGFNLVGTNLNSRLPYAQNLHTEDWLFASRCLLALRRGDLDTAWTNLLVETRLVCARQPAPNFISQFLHFEMVNTAFETFWQTFQTNGWSDAQLAQLQREWELPEFFTNLPTEIALERTTILCDLENERLRPHEDPDTARWARDIFRHPSQGWSNLKEHWRYLTYLQRGIFVDETNQLLATARHESEVKKAVQAATWAQMCTLPGVTNVFYVASALYPQYSTVEFITQQNARFKQIGFGLIGRAAEAETRRRILIVAIALERYHLRHHAYPDSLSVLQPEFLTKIPVDFMDGQPLRYHLTTDGRFTIYSVGLDCVDNHGVITDGDVSAPPNAKTGNTFDLDIVWPLAAPDADANVAHAAQLADQEHRSRR